MVQQGREPAAAGAWGSRCWRPASPSAADVVMFHGRHRHSFIAHAHDEFTVIQVTAGAVRIEIDAVAHTVRPGQLVLIGSNQVHAARPLDGQGWAMRSLHLPAGFFGAPLHFGRPVYAGSVRDHAAFAQWHAACEAGAAQQAEHSYLQFAGWLREALPRFAPGTGSLLPADARIARARSLLAARVFGRETLDDIAEEVGLTSFALIRGFSKSFGLPPHTWRMQARARAAAELIRAQQALAEVADSCGFTDQSHLARVFKRVYGVTPGAWRAAGSTPAGSGAG